MPNSTSQPTSRDPLVGQQLASFRIDGILKRGGMARVYRGWDGMLQRPVAIKVIDTRFRSNPAYAERFLREARAVAAWRHEHIIQVYYADVEDGLYYFVMELVDGLDLGELLGRYAADGELMLHADVLRIGRAIATALTHAHAHGVIHRDVKPSNVMLSVDGRVLLGDFGLALGSDQEGEGEFLGTPHYVAPEQALRGGDALPQSDLYSLAIMLYEMLTGVLPFDDPSLMGLAQRQIMDPPPPPRSINPLLNQAVERVLLKALSKLPKERYQTGAELMAALAAALETGPMLTGKVVALPPRPVQSERTTGERSTSHLSSVSVVEKIARQLGHDKRQQRPMRPTGRKAGQWLVGVSLVALLMTLLVMIVFTQRQTFSGRLGMAMASPTAVSLVELGLTTSLPGPLLMTPALATTPAEAMAIAPTATLQLTVSPTPVATIELTIGATAVAPTLEPIPLLDGPAIAFMYDQYSFYALNPGDQAIEAINLSFFAIDNAGQVAGYRFFGRDWAKFYPLIEPGGCGRIEPIAAPELLRPLECRQYNALVTPTLRDATLFWIPRDNIFLFEVYWDNQIIGRCEIGRGSCQLNLPIG